MWKHKCCTYKTRILCESGLVVGIGRVPEAIDLCPGQWSGVPNWAAVHFLWLLLLLKIPRNWAAWVASPTWGLIIATVTRNVSGSENSLRSSNGKRWKENSDMGGSMYAGHCQNLLSFGQMHITALEGKWSWSPDSHKFPQTLLSRLNNRE